MYKAKYSSRIRLSDNSKQSSNNLKVKFRFRDEVAPKDRKKIDARLSHSSLTSYFYDQENVQATFVAHSSINKRFYFEMGDSKRDFYLDRTFTGIFLKAFGFNLTITSDKVLPLEEMVDLDAINHFVLTGETKNKD